MHTSYSLSLRRNSGSYLDRNTFSLTLRLCGGCPRQRIPTFSSARLSGVDDLIHARAAVLQWIPVNPMKHKLNHRQATGLSRLICSCKKIGLLSTNQFTHRHVHAGKVETLAICKVGYKSNEKKTVSTHIDRAIGILLLIFHLGNRGRFGAATASASRSLFQMNIYICLSKIK